jgi:hypothetical protein
VSGVQSQSLKQLTTLTTLIPEQLHITVFVCYHIMSLLLVIEAGATVCESAKFSLSHPPSSGENNTVGKIKLIIGQGNVFHPYSCFQIIPPTANQKQISVQIGSNNLFEEKSQVILDLSCHGTITAEEEGEQQSSDTLGDCLKVSAIGSYNNFSATCRVECQRIGNANIFGPKSNVLVKSVDNGNLFQAGSFVREDGTNDVRCQERVFYVLTGESNSVIRNKCRKHTDGVRKNIVEVSTLLRACKKILRDNHRIMAVTDFDDEDAL